MDIILTAPGQCDWNILYADPGLWFPPPQLSDQFVTDELLSSLPPTVSRMAIFACTRPKVPPLPPVPPGTRPVPFPWRMILAFPKAAGVSLPTGPSLSHLPAAERGLISDVSTLSDIHRPSRSLEYICFTRLASRGYYDAYGRAPPSSILHLTPFRLGCVGLIPRVAFELGTFRKIPI